MSFPQFKMLAYNFLGNWSLSISSGKSSSVNKLPVAPFLQRKITFCVLLSTMRKFNTCICSLSVSRLLEETIYIAKHCCDTIQWTISFLIFQMWNTCPLDRGLDPIHPSIIYNRSSFWGSWGGLDSKMDKSVHSQTALQHSFLTGMKSCPNL